MNNIIVHTTYLEIAVLQTQTDFSYRSYNLVFLQNKIFAVFKVFVCIWLFDGFGPGVEARKINLLLHLHDQEEPEQILLGLLLS